MSANLTDISQERFGTTITPKQNLMALGTLAFSLRGCVNMNRDFITRGIVMRYPPHQRREFVESIHRSCAPELESQLVTVINCLDQVAREMRTMQGLVNKAVDDVVEAEQQKYEKEKANEV